MYNGYRRLFSWEGKLPGRETDRSLSRLGQIRETEERRSCVLSGPMLRMALLAKANRNLLKDRRLTTHHALELPVLNIRGFTPPLLHTFSWYVT
jgi:hypothetical protein